MLQRSHDTTVDLDLELARQTSNENPVYYVQYAHARIASILRKAGEGAEARAEAADLNAVAGPVEPAERALIKRLCELPDEVGETAARRAPHRLCAYATATAADFHAFYRDCQVVGAEGEGVEDSRLATCLLTKRAIARTLGLLGISAPGADVAASALEVVGGHVALEPGGVAGLELARSPPLAVAAGARQPRDRETDRAGGDHDRPAPGSPRR